MNRITSAIMNWRLQEGAFSLLLLALMLFSVTWSVQAAEWVPDGLWALSPVTLVGLLTGLVLAKLHDVPRYLLHTLGTLIGILFIFYQTSTIMDSSIGNWQDKATELLSRAKLWYIAASSGRSSDDTLLFVLILAAMCWLLAYTSAWFVFRSHWAWWAVAPNAVAILINYSYALRTDSLALYFLLFVFSALLLLARFNLFQHEQKWERERVNYSPNIVWKFLRSSATFCVIITLAFWFIPNSNAANPAVANWVNSWNRPWEDFNANVSKWFSGVSSNKGGSYSYSSFSDSFIMGGKLNLSQNEALIIKQSQPTYIFARAYDTYDGRGWDSSSASKSFQATGAQANRSSLLSLGANEQMRNDDAMRTAITQTITLAAPRGSRVFGTFLPVKSSIPSLLDVSWLQADETLPIALDTDSSRQPVAMRSLIDGLKLVQQQMRTTGTMPENVTDTAGVEAVLDKLLMPGEGKAAGPAIREEINRLAADGVIVDLRIRNFAIVLRYSGQLAVQDDLVGVRTTQNLNPGDTYTLVVYTSVADETTLRNVNASYPKWVTDRYTGLPNSVTERTKQLARQIVSEAGATTTYDKAKAIADYLKRTYPYTTEIEMPPPNLDRVDYFLFTQQKGYCEDFSTAGVVMMRSLGIPTREVTGYAPGSYDSTREAYVYREINSHAWPEVYFPGYGWIQFEPTPGFSGQNRPATPQTPTPIALTSPTPAVTPTPFDRDPDRDPTPLPQNYGSTQNNQPDTPLTTAFKWGLPIVLLLSLIFWWLWSGESRRSYPGGKYYEKLVRWASWAGLGPATHQTPYEYAEQLDRKLPGARGLFRPLANAYVRERFGKQEADDHERASLSRYWLEARSALAKRIPFRWLNRK